MTASGPKSEAALRVAMARLLDGRPERTDGALTVSNLAREAGVSRATANRAVDLLAEFRAAEARRRRSSPQALKDRVRSLEAELRAVRGAGMAELRALTRTLAQHIQLLTLQVAERDAVIAGLQDELARSNEAKVVRWGAGREAALAESHAISSPPAGPAAIGHGRRLLSSPVEAGARLWQTLPARQPCSAPVTENRV